MLLETHSSLAEFPNPAIKLTGNCLRGFTLNDDLNLELATDNLEMSGTMQLNGHSLGIEATSGGFTISGGSIDFAGHDLRINGNVISSGSIALNGGKLTINGDMTYSNGTVDLSGGTLNITGTLYQQSGTMNINSGKLNIGGSYYMAGPGSNYTTKVYKTADVYLLMQHERDEVRVGGNFVTATTRSHYGDLTNGTLYIGGDFQEAAVSWNGRGFYASSNHKTVLNGSGMQSAVFKNNDSRFATLILKQPIEMYVFSPEPCWTTLILPEFGEPSFTLPAALKKIDTSAFEGIKATIVYIPDSCTTIGAYAFRNAAVTQIRIPANCTIAHSAFDGCESVQIFGTSGSPAEAFCNRHDNCVFIPE